jgi:DNA-binding transcriptional LysR family regulator
MALVAAAGSPEPKLEDLTSLPFIRFDRTIGVGRIIDLLLERRNINPRETMELDSVEAILAMVERGLGFAIVPERCVNALQRYRLKLVPIDAPDAERDVVLIWHKDQADKTQMEMLLAALTRAQNRPFQGIA